MYRFLKHESVLLSEFHNLCSKKNVEDDAQKDIQLKTIQTWDTMKYEIELLTWTSFNLSN